MAREHKQGINFHFRKNPYSPYDEARQRALLSAKRYKSQEKSKMNFELKDSKNSDSDSDDGRLIRKV